MPGYFLVDGRNSSIFNFSSAFLRDVACFAFEAFALNRLMKSCNSLRLSSVFCFSEPSIATSIVTTDTRMNSYGENGNLAIINICNVCINRI